MKSPRQVRSDIRTLTTHIGHVRDALHKKVDVTVAEVGKECKRTSDVLAELLKSQDAAENLRRQIKSYLDEISDLKRQLFKAQNQQGHQQNRK